MLGKGYNSPVVGVAFHIWAYCGNRNHGKKMLEGSTKGLAFLNYGLDFFFFKGSYVQPLLCWTPLTSQARQIPSTSQDLGSGMQVGSRRPRSRAVAFAPQRIQNGGPGRCQSEAVPCLSFLMLFLTQGNGEPRERAQLAQSVQGPDTSSALPFVLEHLSNNLLFWVLHSCLLRWRSLFKTRP